MKKNTLSSLTTKKIKIAPHSRNKHKKSSITTIDTIIDTPIDTNIDTNIDTPIDIIINKMEKCSLKEHHYGIIPVYLNFEIMKSNYNKNIKKGGLDNLYMLITKFYVSTIKPPAINIYKGDIPQQYQTDNTRFIQITTNLTLCVVYLNESKFTNLPLSYKTLRYVDFYNHYVDSYDVVDLTYKQITSEIEKNPYRAIINNSFWKKGHIRDINIAMIDNGEIIDNFELALLYNNVMEYVEAKIEK